MAIKIMSHLVAGFPDRKGFIEAAKGLKDGGADILELQIPFSDPTADGPVITRACEHSIERGFRVREVFDYISEAQRIGFDDIVVMTYANIAFSYGIADYVKDLKKAGVKGALVPDLPIEDEEGFYEKSFAADLAPMPVIVVNMPEERRNIFEQMPFKKVYISIRVGITGTATEITRDVTDFLDGLKSYERYAGFGIRSAQQLAALESHADVAVVGSYFTSLIEDAYQRKDSIYTTVKSAITCLRK